MDVAVLNDKGVLVEVRSVDKGQWKTDHKSRQVQLESGHDMRQRIGQYRYDFNAGYFMPISEDPVQNAFEAPDLIEGIIHLIEELDRGSAIDVPLTTKLAVAAYKRSIDFSKGKSK